MEASAPLPLILSLQLDPASSAWFTHQRERFFPPERNFIPAHVTLFHALPDAELPSIAADLRRITPAQPPFPLTVTGLRSLGRGVAFNLHAPGLISLRRSLAEIWWDQLTPQDRQNYKPHITIQNKVTSETARDTLAILQAAPLPTGITALGLQLWAYRNGPWEHLDTFPFTAAENR